MSVSNILAVKGNILFAVSPDTPLQECLVAMADNDVGALLVMRKGRLAGLLTFREVIRVLASRDKAKPADPMQPSRTWLQDRS